MPPQLPPIGAEVPATLNALPPIGAEVPSSVPLPQPAGASAGMLPASTGTESADRRRAAIDEAMALGRRLVPGPTGGMGIAGATGSAPMTAAKTVGGRVMSGVRAAAPAVVAAGAQTAINATLPAWAAVPLSTALALRGMRGARVEAPKPGTFEVSAPATNARFTELPARPAGVSPSRPPSASPASPIVSTPVAPAPPPSPAAPQAPAPALPVAPQSAPIPPARSGWSPQRIRNEVGLAARRGSVRLSEAEMEAADALVAQGSAPAEAIAKTVAARRVPKLSLKADEQTEYAKLRNSGKTHQEAARVIEQLRELAKLPGVKTSAEAKAAIKARQYKQ